MDPPLFEIKDLTSLPLERVGPPNQIGYYSYFPEKKDPLVYLSSVALNCYKQRDPGFVVTQGHKEGDFRGMCSRADDRRHPQYGMKPFTGSCHEDDLDRADVITGRGVLVKYICFLVVLAPGLLDLAYRWARKGCTLFPLRKGKPLGKGNCVSSGRPSNRG